jgi:hypothetical protein
MFSPEYNFYNTYSLNFKNTTLRTKLNTNNLKSYTPNNITLSESRYVYGTFDNDINSANKNRTLSLSLDKLNRFLSKPKNPSNFDFNIENNLNISKQQRWLVKNSLLSESILNNSFLITQSKKLIGLGTLDKDYTSKTL